MLHELELLTVMTAAVTLAPLPVFFFPLDLTDGSQMHQVFLWLRIFQASKLSFLKDHTLLHYCLPSIISFSSFTTQGCEIPLLRVIYPP